MQIRPITQENRQEAVQLCVYDFQKDYIETVQECLQEADACKDWHPVGLYVNNTIVGFAMYGKITEEKYTRVWFDRLLIDCNQQSKGYGKLGFELVLDLILREYENEEIYLSVYDQNERAMRLYQNHGFEKILERDSKGEQIMKYRW